MVSSRGFYARGVFGRGKVEAPARLELATYGLGNRCSIHLSYGAEST